MCIKIKFIPLQFHSFYYNSLDKLKVQMSIFLGKSILEKKIIQYEITDLRVEDLLKDIASLLQHASKQEKDIQSCKALLYKFLQKAKKQLKVGNHFRLFKLAVLIYLLVVEQQKNNSLDKTPLRTILQLAKKIIIKILNLKEDQELTNYKNQNLYLIETIHCLMLYLQKKIQIIQLRQQTKNFDYDLSPDGFDLNKKLQYNQVNLSQNSQIIKKEYQIIKKLEYHYAQCYKIINLINKGLKFSQNLLPIVRYFSVKHKYMVDFNIVTAIDMEQNYSILKTSFQQVKMLQQNLGIQSQQYEQLIKQTQRVRERLLPLFINSYNYYHLAKYVPQWIQVDQQNTKQPQQLPRKSTKQSKYSRQEVNPQCCFLSLVSTTQRFEEQLFIAPILQQQKIIKLQHKSVSILSDLQQFVAANLNRQKVRLCKTTRRSKARSFYEIKNLQFTTKY